MYKLRELGTKKNKQYKTWQELHTGTEGVRGILLSHSHNAAERSREFL